MLKTIYNRFKINSSRVFLDAFAKSAAESLSPGSIMLDAGAGDCPYKSYFSHVIYESADFCKLDKDYGDITYVCDLRDIPVESDKYDLVFCSQTLEHVPEPMDVMKEFHRILKPSGQLRLSAPFYFEEHEIPYDYFRYTQYGFRHLLESAGFTVVEMHWLEGYYGTLSYQLSIAMRALPTRPEHYGGGVKGMLGAVIAFFAKPLFGLLSLYYSRLDIRKIYTHGGHNKNYTVIANKI